MPSQDAPAAQTVVAHSCTLWRSRREVDRVGFFSRNILRNPKLAEVGNSDEVHIGVRGGGIPRDAASPCDVEELTTVFPFEFPDDPADDSVEFGFLQRGSISGAISGICIKPEHEN